MLELAAVLEVSPARIIKAALKHLGLLTSSTWCAARRLHHVTTSSWIGFTSHCGVPSYSDGPSPPSCERGSSWDRRARRPWKYLSRMALRASSGRTR